MAKALYKLFKMGGEAHLKDLDLTVNQFTNFQKMKYFGLVENIDDHGQRKRGVWKITDLGISFVHGRSQVPRSVYTYRGDVVERTDEHVYVWQLSKEYLTREDYLNECGSI
jgi:hypothetical protein